MILPGLFYFLARNLYRWWNHWDIWYKEENPWTMLEITPPSEVLKPYRAMEDFFTSVFWPVYDSPNWRETWCEGELTNGPFWFSFEVASDGGEVHFYLRVIRGMRKVLESAIQAHYPDIEMQEVEDYTQKVPQNLPDRKEYRMYAEDFVLHAKQAYPITTYKFFEIRPEETEEEKKLDPFSSLMEAMAKLQKGETLWLQIIINPVTNQDFPWATEGKGIVNELARREGPLQSKSITGETYRFLVHGKTPFEEKEEEKPIIPPEMKLTPGERQTLQAVEEKISKHGFRTTIRTVYFATPREKYFSPNGKIVRGYFSHFTSQNLNTIRFYGRTRTKIHYFFRKRRIYNREKNIFTRYIKRFPPLFPERQEGTMILTADELATVFHFPIKAALLPPGVPRVSAKKGVPPSIIPGEAEEE